MLNAKKILFLSLLIAVIAFCVIAIAASFVLQQRKLIAVESELQAAQKTLNDSFAANTEFRTKIENDPQCAGYLLTPLYLQ